MEEITIKNQLKLTHRSSSAHNPFPVNSPPTSRSNSPATSTINLNREYTLAIHTHSYNEIHSKIHRQHHENQSQRLTIEFLLQPGRNSIQEALCSAPRTRLTELVTCYLDSSEEASRLCFSLYVALDQARSIYAPITHLLDMLSIHSGSSTSNSGRITQAQCDWACNILQEFDRHDNPFSTVTTTNNDRSSFKGMRECFPDLKKQLDLRLLNARRKHRILRQVTQGSGVCLVASTMGLMAAGLLLATHALVTFMAAPVLLIGFRGTGDLLAGPRQRLRNAVAQLDAAARGAFVLSNDLDTIDRLVDKIRESIDSDKVLVHSGLVRGIGQPHQIGLVLRSLAKNHSSFLQQLEDLEEHIFLYFAAVNRSRSLLLHQLQSNLQQNS